MNRYKGANELCGITTRMDMCGGAPRMDVKSVELLLYKVDTTGCSHYKSGLDKCGILQDGCDRQGITTTVDMTSEKSLQW
jgi:hypothetical protein